MKTAYEAGNALEAHMLQDVLRREDVEAGIHGEFLPGAIGELPAAGLVRLVVADEDYARARAVIECWETTSVADPAPMPAKRTPSRLVAAVAGLAIGIGGSYAYFRAPVMVDGIDYNRDGVLDVRWIRSPSGIAVEGRIDRNFDGKTDYIEYFDENGYIKHAEADNDFNGVFETRHQYSLGNVVATGVDTDGDGLPNLKSHYKHGVAVSTEYINPFSGQVFRVEHYDLGGVTRADVDTNADGKVDKRLIYSPAAEIVRTKQTEPAR
ncbi:MAG: DUF2007 domain-containing protein [Betaproteobacteria bacterium]|nr:DUF2007 domain-containing protein [Betaproteobacteria bacterium]